MNIRPLVVPLTLFLLGLSCTPPTRGQSSAARLLKEAYRKKSPELLDRFFMEWHAEIPPIGDNELQALNAKRSANATGHSLPFTGHYPLTA